MQTITKFAVLDVVVITKKNCVRIFAVSMGVISAMTGNPRFHKLLSLNTEALVLHRGPLSEFESHLFNTSIINRDDCTEAV